MHILLSLLLRKSPQHGYARDASSDSVVSKTCSSNDDAVTRHPTPIQSIANRHGHHDKRSGKTGRETIELSLERPGRSQTAAPPPPHLIVITVLTNVLLIITIILITIQLIAIH